MGTMVHTVSVPVRKLARVGRPASRRSRARTSGSDSDFADPAAAPRRPIAASCRCNSATLPRLGRRDIGQGSHGVGERGHPQVNRLPVRPTRRPQHRDGRRIRQIVRRDRCRPPTSSSGSARPTQLWLVGHGDPEQDPVESGPPGVLSERLQLVLGAMGRVQSPADSHRGDPVAHRGQLVVGEGEPATHQGDRGQVENVGRGEPRTGQVDQPRSQRSRPLVCRRARSASWTRSPCAG